MIKTIVLHIYRTVKVNISIYRISEKRYNAVKLSPHMFYSIIRIIQANRVKYSTET